MVTFFSHPVFFSFTEGDKLLSFLTLSFFTGLSWANPGELTFALQRYNALAGRKLLIVASGPQAVDLANKCKKIDPFLNYYIHPVSSYVNINREIKKAQTTYGAKCALHLSIRNRQWRLNPHGICHDPTRTLSIKEQGKKWTLIDNKKREVRAIDYAVLTKDEDLLKVLKTEERKSYEESQRLVLGASLIAGSAIIPLLFGPSEETAQLEDRRWSAIFLAASGGLLYQASKIPPMKKKGKNISNYRPKIMVSERLLEVWPPPEKPKEESKEESKEEAKEPQETNANESPEGEPKKEGDDASQENTPQETTEKTPSVDQPESKDTSPKDPTESSDQESSSDSPPTDDVPKKEIP